MINYENILSDIIKDIPPSGIRRFFSIAAEMEDCISLGVGEPDFVTPWDIRQAGIQSLEKGSTWYTANSGLADLRKEICNYLDRRFGLQYDSETETLVTVGGSEAIDIMLRALINRGDEVIIPQPCYVSYEPITRLCGGVPVIINTKAENAFRLTGEELKNAITPRTKVLILPFPNNPTGAIMEKEHLEEIADVLKGTEIMILSDEVYAELTYGKKHISIASINDDMKQRTIIASGFSKAYAMTGWRLGYACGPAPVIKQMTKIHQFAILAAPTTSQFAAIVAMRDGDESVENMVADYAMRRRFLVDGLEKIGLPCFEPRGAFYVFPSIAASGMGSLEFCEKLLQSKRVAVVSGDSFGASGEGYVRISYSYSINHLTEALKRMGEFMEDIKAGKVK